MSRRGSTLGAFVVCVLLAFFGVRAGATLLLNDSFSDGEYTTQSLPGSAHWYIGGPNPNMSITSSGLTFGDASAGKAEAMAYFTPTDLAIGASLTLKFNYSFAQTATADNAFMFGLYNSGGNYLSKDSSLSFNNNIFNNYTGYATSGVFGVDPSGPGRDHIEVRNQTGFNLLSIGTYSEGNEFKQVGAATPGQMYEASMKISRTASGITVQSQIGSTTMTQTYNSSMFTKFDTVGIFSNGDTGSFSMDNVQLDYIGAPEPSTFYALAFLGVTVFGNLLRQTIQKALRQPRPRLSFSEVE